MNRRAFLKAISAAAISIGWCRNSFSAVGKKKPPNIVVILSDDQGYADVSYHDHPKEVHTPAIDRLAASGIRMTNGYASAPVCAPTRAGLLTGRYQQRFGFYKVQDSRIGMPLSEITVADLLKKNGYATGVFGKWHLGLAPEYHPLKRGFDEFYGFLGHGGRDYFNLKRDPEKEHAAIYRNGDMIDDTGYLTDNLAREACAFIERHKDGPFFLYLAFNAVHSPLQAPKEDIALFDSGDENRNILMAMLRRMDIAVGNVLDALNKAGVSDNTLIFYFSDNGGARATSANNMPLRSYKDSYYEGGLRVPFIVSWPGTLKPGSCDEPVISLDIMPTICAAAGIALPEDRTYDGRNMIPVLRKETADSLHERLFWGGNDGSWAVREGKWKLVFRKRENKLELYDLKADIGEKNDIAQKHPDTVRRLEKEFWAWRKEMAPPIGNSTPESRKHRKESND
jgi:arylsulfatase A-like enzyme